MNERTKVVATTSDYLVAHVWRDLLESAGIPADVSGEGAGSLYPKMSPLASLSIVVRKEDALRAHTLLAEMQRGGDP